MRFVLLCISNMIIFTIWPSECLSVLTLYYIVTAKYVVSVVVQWGSSQTPGSTPKEITTVAAVSSDGCLLCLLQRLNFCRTTLPGLWQNASRFCTVLNDEKHLRLKSFTTAFFFFAGQMVLAEPRDMKGVHRRKRWGTHVLQYKHFTYSDCQLSDIQCFRVCLLYIYIHTYIIANCCQMFIVPDILLVPGDTNFT